MLLGLGLNLNKGGFVSSPYYSVLASAFRSRVQSDGGQVGNMSCLKSDLKELNPTKPSAFTGLLNDYSGAAAAYSLRLLDNTYTGDAIVVRRASDNTTQAIGFVNNELDTASLESFCSGTDGFVTTWYDQSGNGNDATQASASAQPKIVSSGSTILDGGKPSLQLTESSLETNLSLVTDVTHYLFSVLKTNDTAGIQYWSYDTNTKWVFILQQGNNATSISDRFSINSIYKNGTAQSLGTRNDWYNAFGDNNKHLSTLIGSANQNDWNSLGFFGYTGFRLNGFSQEIIIWDSEQSANQSGIETNINDFYSIY